MKAIDELIDTELRAKRRLYSTVPTFAIPKPKHTDSTANGLTKAILSLLALEGHYGSRIQSQGQWQPRLGLWTKSSVRRGIGDIMAVINGKSVMIEVKIGKDRQSEWQKRTQAEVEASGGVYLVVKTFDDFMEWYKHKSI